MPLQKCYGGECPVKDKCLRFTKKSHEYMQPYFKAEPFVIEYGYFMCQHFIGGEINGLLNRKLENLEYI